MSNRMISIGIYWNDELNTIFWLMRNVHEQNNADQ